MLLTKAAYPSYNQNMTVHEREQKAARSKRSVQDPEHKPIRKRDTLSTKTEHPTDGIAERLKQIQGPRSFATMAEKMGCSRTTAHRIIGTGEIPDPFLYLRRLRKEEGIDLNWLICGEDNGR